MGSVSAGVARAVAGQFDWIWTPKYGADGQRLVVLLHGQLQTGQEWWAPSTSPAQTRIARALRRFPMVSVYTSGASWGNATARGNLETVRAWASSIGCATDKLIIVGASMGGFLGLQYARYFPSRVAALLLIMPAVDIEGVRDANLANAQANINTAYGKSVGSTSSTEPLDAADIPLNQANADLVKSSGAPIRLYYSSADTISLPAHVETLRNRLGMKAHLVSTSLDHSDALFDAVPKDDMIDVIGRVA